MVQKRDHIKEQKSAKTVNDNNTNIEESFEYIDYIDCIGNRFLCQDAGVTGYPTWCIGSTDYPGAQTFAKLSELSGCPLPI